MHCIGYFFGINSQYPKELHELHNDLQFSPGKVKTGRIEKRLLNFNDRKEYRIHI